MNWKQALGQSMRCDLKACSVITNKGVACTFDPYRTYSARPRGSGSQIIDLYDTQGKHVGTANMHGQQ